MRAERVVVLISVVDDEIRVRGCGLEARGGSEQPIASAKHLLAKARLTRSVSQRGEPHGAANRTAVLTGRRPFDDLDGTEAGIVDVVENRETGSVRERNVIEENLGAESVRVRTVAAGARVVAADRDARAAPRRAGLHHETGRRVDGLLETEAARALQIGCRELDGRRCRRTGGHLDARQPLLGRREPDSKWLCRVSNGHLRTGVPDAADGETRDRVWRGESERSALIGHGARRGR